MRNIQEYDLALRVFDKMTKGALTKNEMARTRLEIAETFIQMGDSEKAEIRAVATSAVREAENRFEFLEKVKKETGINIEVISGTEEGRLIYIGTIHALPVYEQKALILDIGGGSTETIVGYKSDIFYVNSTKLGAIRLTKRFFPNGKATSKQIQ